MVNVAVDGASLPTNTATFFGPYSTWDLGSIEILRGPQSTQSGRNALAGTVRINSADPVHYLEAKARAEVGQADTYRGSLAVNLPLITETLAVRLSTDHSRTDGWVTNPTMGTDDYDKRAIDTSRVKFLYTPNERSKTVIGYSITDNSGGEDSVDLNAEEERTNRSDLPALEESLHKIANIENNYQLGSHWSVVSDASYYNHDYYRQEDGDNSASPGSALTRTAETEALSAQVRFKYQADKVNGTFGLYATDINSQSNSRGILSIAFLNPALDGVPGFIDAQFADEVDTVNVAAFGEADLSLTDRIIVTAGLRYDNEQQERVDSSDTTVFVNPNPESGELPERTLIAVPSEVAGLLPIVPESGTQVSDGDFDALLPKLGISYQLTEQAKVGFVAQRGYRAGGVSRNVFTGSLSQFDPEYLTNYELNLRYATRDNRLTTRANAYYGDWKDQQIEVQGDSGDPNDTMVVNAGRSKIYGAEVDVNYRATASISTYSSLGYARTQFIEFESFGRDFSGNDFPLAPRLTAAIGALWDITDRWSIDVNGSYQSDSFSDSANTENQKTDARTLWNIKAGYSGEQWGVNLVGRNIFDEYYVTQRFPRGERGRTGEPRVISLQVTYNLD